MMENNFDSQPLDEEITKGSDDHDFQFSESLQNSWGEIANWSGFYAILLLFFAIVLLLGFQSALDSFFGVSTDVTLILGLFVVFLAMLGACFWLVSARLKNGMDRSETETIEAGFSFLLWAYRAMGGILIFYLLVLIAFFIIRLNLLARGIQ